MSFDKLQWLFPVAVAIHNSEEAIWMPTWARDHASQLPVQPPSGAVIRTGLVALTMAAFVITYLSARSGPGSVWTYLTFGSIITMLANVFVPHLPATVVFRSYTPGVLTAVTINLPLMSYLAVRAIRDRWIGGWKAAAYAVVVPVAIGGAILILFRTVR